MKTRLAIVVAFSVLFVMNPIDVTSQDLGDKVYWMATAEVRLADLAAYHAMNENEQVPLLEKHGYNVIGVWQTIVGDIEEVVILAEFENMTAYHEARKSVLGSEEWKALSEKHGGLTKSIRSRFLSAAPYSKLK